MKGKIDEKGRLSIWRGNKWRTQFCPFGGQDVECSDYCPQFGEPVTGGEIMIMICQDRALFFDEFEDERK